MTDEFRAAVLETEFGPLLTDEMMWGPDPKLWMRRLGGKLRLLSVAEAMAWQRLKDWVHDRLFEWRDLGEPRAAMPLEIWCCEQFRVGYLHSKREKRYWKPDREGFTKAQRAAWQSHELEEELAKRREGYGRIRR